MSAEDKSSAPNAEPAAAAEASTKQLAFDEDLEEELRRILRCKSSSSSIQIPTKTLFDWKLDRKFRGDDTRKSLLHRMVLVSKMYHQNFSEIGQWYEKFFKDVQNQYQCEGVTGLLLLYPRHCVHVVESCLEVLIELLRSVQHEADTGTGNMEVSKILIVSHDIPHRQYNQWSFRILDIEAPQIEEYDHSEEPDRMVTDMLNQLLKLGAHISKQPKVSLKNAMDSLHDKVPEFLPQQDVIGYLLEHEEQCITTPLQYLSKYDQPYDVIMASDLVWPLPTRVFPYN